MRTIALLWFSILLILPQTAIAGDTTVQLPDGVVSWTPATPAVPGAQMKGEFPAARWGMYDVSAQLAAAAAGKVKLSIAGKDFVAPADGTSADVKLGRVYFDKNGKFPLTIDAEPADAAKPLTVKSLLFTPAPEGKPIVQSDDLSITLHAHDATVHGHGLRYEFNPAKNTLGFWGSEKDWVSWDFELKKPGKFIVFAMQGSNGGSEIEIAVGEQKLNWTTKNSGGFHTFTFLEAGTLSLDKPGPLTLTLKPTKKVGGAIMDLREVILLPVLK